MLMIMQPNQQYIPRPSGQDPYEFITNPGKPPKRSRLGGGSMKARLMLVVGVGFVLAILFVVVSSVLNSSNNNAAKSLKSIVLQQQEIVRLSGLGAASATDPTTRSNAVTVQLSVQSQQKELSKYLESRGITVTKEELALTKKASVDKELESATSNNRYDDVFNELLHSQLTDYAASLKEAYDASNTPASKELLTASFNSTTAILKKP